MKTAVSARDSRTGQAGQLRALYLLRPSGGQEVVAARVTGGGKFPPLQECLYGPMFAEEHPALFPLMSAVVAPCRFTASTGPRRGGRSTRWPRLSSPARLLAARKP
jgi:hypothetical protein